MKGIGKRRWPSQMCSINLLFMLNMYNLTWLTNDKFHWFRCLCYVVQVLGFVQCDVTWTMVHVRHTQYSNSLWFAKWKTLFIEQLHRYDVYRCVQSYQYEWHLPTFKMVTIIYIPQTVLHIVLIYPRVWHFYILVKKVRKDGDRGRKKRFDEPRVD